MKGCARWPRRLKLHPGWSAHQRCPVDNFVYEEANDTFINDAEMNARRLVGLNPHSFAAIVGTLLEVNGRGIWETSEEKYSPAPGDSTRRSKTGIEGRHGFPETATSSF